VTCIVNGYAEECCQIFRQRATARPAPPQLDPSLPDSLDRDAIAAGLAGIDVRGCRSLSTHGDVSASLKVVPDGTVAAVTVKSSPDASLGDCVTAAARKATFARTQRGRTFAYVWRL
jgi:hypothetical protein